MRRRTWANAGRSTSLIGAIVILLAMVGGGSASGANQLKVEAGVELQPALGQLGGVASIVSDGEGYCAVLTSGGVDCWGYGYYGQLGNGKFYTKGDDGSAVPVQVVGLGGTGTLSGVASLVTVGEGGFGYCALLTSGGVDCWGDGYYGQLGNGTFYADGSAVPVQVVGLGGSGVLSGVASLVSNGDDYCALLTSGGIDCWGWNNYGQLGDGKMPSDYPYGASAFPVQVVGVGDSGVLSGVARVATNEAGVNGLPAFCAVLTSGGVDCWGAGTRGELGDGKFYDNGSGSSDVPIQVEAVGDTGALDAVASIASDGDNGFCAVLTSGGVDCWGWGSSGQLGNGKFYQTGNEGSAVPVQVKGVGNTGTLSGVASIAGIGQTGYCALLTSGGVDCWGNGYNGQLGNGKFYQTGNEGSAVPVQVKGVGSTGTLSGVASVASDESELGYCARLTSGGVDCWGWGGSGQLGDGRFYKSGNVGSAVPVQVEAVGGTGILSGVASIASDSEGVSGEVALGYCAALTSGGVDCWGTGYSGDLGNGKFYQTGDQGSAVPVQVEAVAGTGALSGISDPG